MLFVDFREKALSEALDDVPHRICNLPVGDVVCEYTEKNLAWAAERKQARDLAESMISKHLSEQSARLHTAGYAQVFWLIEGDLHDRSVAHQNLLGCCVNMALRKDSIMIRTRDVNETAAVIKQLMAKAISIPGIPTGLAPPAPLTKRKRDADKKIIYLRQLMCIPGVSEAVANRLVEHFETLPALQHALKDLGNFPNIQVTAKSSLGRARLSTIRDQLCDILPDSEANDVSRTSGKKRVAIANFPANPIQENQGQHCRHEMSKVFPDGPRDNGEFEWRCKICGIKIVT